MMAWLPLVAIAAGAVEAPCEVVTPARAAQVRLAETLAEADAIESVAVSRDEREGGVTVMFSIVRDGEQWLVAATTGRDGEVAALTLGRAGPAAAEVNGLTWLTVELSDAPSIVRLAAADRGAVLLSTGDGRRYLVSPKRRGPRTGNEAVEARWGAAWTNGA
jgi:hypothetical protein